MLWMQAYYIFIYFIFQWTEFHPEHDKSGLLFVEFSVTTPLIQKWQKKNLLAALSVISPVKYHYVVHSGQQKAL